MILQMEPNYGPEVQQAINEYFLDQPWLTEFKKTQELESLLCDFTGIKHSIMVNNGTLSLAIILWCLGITNEDEVLVPNFTMIATANSVTITGATPRFVPVCEKTFLMSLAEAKNRVNEKTKAVIFVNSNGRNPIEGIELWREWAEEEGLYLIEDSAQSLGSYYSNGRHHGSAGIASSFSFSMPKIITMGQGGAIMTNDDSLAEKIRRFKDFGRSGGGNDFHDYFGLNFKITDIQAVIGIEQMKVLKKRIKTRKEIQLWYSEYFPVSEKVQLMPFDLKFSTPWFTDILAENRDELIQFLKERGIQTRVMYPEINNQRIYRHDYEIFDTSAMIAQKGLWLPSSTKLKRSEIQFICESISEFYGV